MPEGTKDVGPESSAGQETQEAQDIIEDVEEISGPDVLDIDAELAAEAEEARVKAEEAKNPKQPDEEPEREAEPEVKEPEVEPKSEDQEPKTEEIQVPLSRLRKEAQKRKKEEARIQELEKKLQELQNPAPVQESNQAPVDHVPTLSEYNYDEQQYAAAMARYNEHLVERKIQEREAARKEAEAKANEEARQAALNQKLEEFYNSNTEYQKVMKEIIDLEEDVVYPPAVARAVSSSDKAPEIDLYLLRNRYEILPKLSKMDVEQQLIEIGRIQAQIEYNSSDSQKAAPVQQEPKRAEPKNIPPDPISTARSGTRPKSLDAELIEAFGGKFELK